MPVAGYSGTPLAKKLGLESPMTLVAINAPAEYRAWLGKLPNGVSIVSTSPRTRCGRSRCRWGSSTSRSAP